MRPPGPLTLTNGRVENLTWRDVYKIWSLRKNFEEGKRKMKEIPDNGYWLYMHLYKSNYDFIEYHEVKWGIENKNREIENVQEN